MNNIKKILDDLQKEFPNLSVDELQECLKSIESAQPHIEADSDFKVQLSQKLAALAQLQNNKTMEKTSSFLKGGNSVTKVLIGFSSFAFCLGAFAFIFSSFDFFDGTSLPHEIGSQKIQWMSEEYTPQSVYNKEEQNIFLEVLEDEQEGHNESILHKSEQWINNSSASIQVEEYYTETEAVLGRQEIQAKSNLEFSTKTEAISDVQNTTLVEASKSQEEQGNVWNTETITEYDFVQQKNADEHQVETQLLNILEEEGNIQATERLFDESLYDIENQDLSDDALDIMEYDNTSMMRSMSVEEVGADLDIEQLEVYTDSSLSSQFEKLCALYEWKYIAEKELCIKEKVRCLLVDFIEEGEETCSFFHREE